MNIYITPEANKRLWAYIQATQDEISGLGKVVREGSDLTITEIYLLDQECTASSTEMDAESISELLINTIQRGDDPSEIKLWWHSHGNMQVFWSQTDQDTASEFNNEWMLSFVGNRAGKYLCRVDVYKPFQLTADNLTVKIVEEEDPAFEEAIKAEVKAKVRKKPIVIKPGQPYSAVQYYKSNQKLDSDDWKYWDDEDGAMNPYYWGG